MRKTINSLITGGLLAVMAVLALASNSFAAIDLTGVTFPLTECEAIAALILAALAGLWVIRKVLSLVRTR